MKVAIFGGTGFVGSYLIDELLAHEHEPILLVRPGSENKLLQADRCRCIPGDIGDEHAVRNTVAGSDAVIYNIGILREYPNRGITFRALHYIGAQRTIDVAQSEGVNRFLLMSANGVKAKGTAYQETKYMAEEYLRSSNLDWTIFRPSVLFGDPRGKIEFASQLYRDVIRSPLPAPLFYSGWLPVNAGTFRMTPIHVRDVATIFVKALSMPEAIHQTYALGGLQSLEWQEILKIIARAGGTSKLRLPAPVWLLKWMASALDWLEFFPVTRDQLTMLMEGNTCDSSAIFETFGIEPMPFNEDALAYLSF